jgi:hypothetical protein
MGFGEKGGRTNYECFKYKIEMGISSMCSFSKTRRRTKKAP